MTTLRNGLAAVITALVIGATIVPAAAANSVTVNSNGSPAGTILFPITIKPPTGITVTPPATTGTTTPTVPIPSVTTVPAADSTSQSGVLTAMEQQMVTLVNQDRVKFGFAPLTVDMRLVNMARIKSQDMITNHYTSHISPVYGSPVDMMKTLGITYRTMGENIAGAATVVTAYTNLMNSAGHRSNILSPNYTRIGIGIVQGGPYGLMITQEFIG